MKHLHQLTRMPNQQSIPAMRETGAGAQGHMAKTWRGPIEPGLRKIVAVAAKTQGIVAIFVSDRF